MRTVGPACIMHKNSCILAGVTRGRATRKVSPSLELRAYSQALSLSWMITVAISIITQRLKYARERSSGLEIKRFERKIVLNTHENLQTYRIGGRFERLIGMIFSE